MLVRQDGHLVAMGSLAALRGLPGAGARPAAKAALASSLESLRTDPRGTGVDVTLLAPGLVRTRPGKQERRPFVHELEDATARMASAIDRRDRVYAFPLPLVALLGLARLLPRGRVDRQLAGRGPKPKAK